VVDAAARQMQRSGCLNGRLDGSGLRAWCGFDRTGEALLEAASNRFALSGRAQDGIRRVARTLADLAGHDVIDLSQVAEAISLRAERQLGSRSGAPAEAG
jgi:magnesium chelatase family protein